MATANTNEIRPTSLPPYCSACFDQKPQKQYIDFDAAADRGWAPDGQSMDDLILCEDCIKSAAVLLGMRDTKEVATELRRLANENARMRRERDRSVEYARKLEDALKERPELVAKT
jgi:hypothetical protein